MPSPAVSPTGDQSPSKGSDAEEVLTWTVEAQDSPAVLEDDAEGVVYGFWLNGAEELKSAERLVSDFPHPVRRSDVSTFTVDLTDVPAARDECHKTAIRFNSDPQNTWDEVWFDESVDVTGVRT